MQEKSTKPVGMIVAGLVVALVVAIGGSVAWRRSAEAKRQAEIAEMRALIKRGSAVLESIAADDVDMSFPDAPAIKYGAE